MLWYHILIGLFCLIVAFWLGGINGRKVKRAARRELDANSLNMLKSKSRFIENESRNIDIERKEKLLQDTLVQLKDSITEAESSDEKALRSDMHVKKLQQDLITFSKKQNSTHALWKQKAQDSHNLAVQSHIKAVQATALARKTALHLKQLEDIAIGTQSLSGAEPKSHGTNGQVKLSIIDQTRLGYEKEISKHVANGKSSRLALN